MQNKKEIPRKYKHLLNSKWTSVEPLRGWKHYQVIEASFDEMPVKALIQSVCRNNIILWIEAADLKDRNKWLPGWKRIVKDKEDE